MKNILRSIAVLALLLIITRGLANEPKLNLELEKDSKSLVFEMNSKSSMRSCCKSTCKPELVAASLRE